MWQLFTRKAKGAALIAALFSVSLAAQEQITPGNRQSPYQPPAWFVRMATPPIVVVELDSFMVGSSDRPLWHGKPTNVGIKYPCKPEKDQKGVLKWQFCEM